MNRSERFLKIFREIERILKRLSGSSQRATAGQALKELLKKRREDKGAEAFISIVRHFADDLQALVDLRNAIVHNTEGLLGEPTDKAIELAEKILNHLKNPPTVQKFMNRGVYFVEGRDPLGKVLEIMYEKEYSQVPVLENGQLEDLLTTNTVARWLAVQAKQGEVKVDDVQVKDVLKFREESEKWDVISQGTNLFEVLERFEKFRTLVALVITQNGQKTEKPLGIVTPWDLTEIYREVEIHRSR